MCWYSLTQTSQLQVPRELRITEMNYDDKKAFGVNPCSLQLFVQLRFCNSCGSGARELSGRIRIRKRGKAWCQSTRVSPSWWKIRLASGCRSSAHWNDNQVFSEFCPAVTKLSSHCCPRSQNVGYWFAYTNEAMGHSSTPYITAPATIMAISGYDWFEVQKQWTGHPKNLQNTSS